MKSDELVHVPTVAELAKEGLAKALVAPSTKSKGGGTYQLTPEGQRRITDAMMHNGRILAADADERERKRLAAVAAANARKVEIDDHSGQGWQHKG